MRSHFSNRLDNRNEKEDFDLKPRTDPSDQNTGVK